MNTSQSQTPAFLSQNTLKSGPLKGGGSPSHSNPNAHRRTSPRETAAVTVASPATPASTSSSAGPSGKNAQTSRSTPNSTNPAPSPFTPTTTRGTALLGGVLATKPKPGKKGRGSAGTTVKSLSGSPLAPPTSTAGRLPSPSTSTSTAPRSDSPCSGRGKVRIESVAKLHLSSRSPLLTEALSQPCITTTSPWDTPAGTGTSAWLLSPTVANPTDSHHQARSLNSTTTLNGVGGTNEGEGDSFVKDDRGKTATPVASGCSSSSFLSPSPSTAGVVPALVQMVPAKLMERSEWPPHAMRTAAWSGASKGGGSAAVNSVANHHTSGASSAVGAACGETALTSPAETQNSCHSSSSSRAGTNAKQGKKGHPLPSNGSDETGQQPSDDTALRTTLMGPPTPPPPSNCAGASRRSPPTLTHSSFTEEKETTMVSLGISSIASTSQQRSGRKHKGNRESTPLPPPPFRVSPESVAECEESSVAEMPPPSPSTTTAAASPQNHSSSKGKPLEPNVCEELHTALPLPAPTPTAGAVPASFPTLTTKKKKKKPKSTVSNATSGGAAHPTTSSPAAEEGTSSRPAEGESTAAEAEPEESWASRTGEPDRPPSQVNLGTAGGSRPFGSKNHHNHNNSNNSSINSKAGGVGNPLSLPSGSSPARPAQQPPPPTPGVPPGVHLNCGNNSFAASSSPYYGGGGSYGGNPNNGSMSSINHPNTNNNAAYFPPTNSAVGYGSYVPYPAPPPQQSNNGFYGPPVGNGNYPYGAQGPQPGMPWNTTPMTSAQAPYPPHNGGNGNLMHVHHVHPHPHNNSNNGGGGGYMGPVAPHFSGGSGNPNAYWQGGMPYNGNHSGPNNGEVSFPSLPPHMMMNYWNGSTTTNNNTNNNNSNNSTCNVNNNTNMFAPPPLPPSMYGGGPYHPGHPHNSGNPNQPSPLLPPGGTHSNTSSKPPPPAGQQGGMGGAHREPNASYPTHRPASSLSYYSQMSSSGNANSGGSARYAGELHSPQQPLTAQPHSSSTSRAKSQHHEQPIQPLRRTATPPPPSAADTAVRSESGVAEEATDGAHSRTPSQRSPTQSKRNPAHLSPPVPPCAREMWTSGGGVGSSSFPFPASQSPTENSSTNVSPRTRNAGGLLQSSRDGSGVFEEGPAMGDPSAASSTTPHCSEQDHHRLTQPPSNGFTKMAEGHTPLRAGVQTAGSGAAPGMLPLETNTAARVEVPRLSSPLTPDTDAAAYETILSAKSFAPEVHPALCRLVEEEVLRYLIPSAAGLRVRRHHMEQVACAMTEVIAQVGMHRRQPPYGSISFYIYGSVNMRTVLPDGDNDVTLEIDGLIPHGGATTVGAQSLPMPGSRSYHSGAGSSGVGGSLASASPPPSGTPFIPVSTDSSCGNTEGSLQITTTSEGQPFLVPPVTIGLAAGELLQGVREYLMVMQQQASSPIHVDSLVSAEVKVLKLVVNGYHYDFTVGQAGGVNCVQFFHEMDEAVGHEHLLKRTMLLLKSWFSYEAHILGGQGGYLGSYAVSILLISMLNMVEFLEDVESDDEKDEPEEAETRLGEDGEPASQHTTPAAKGLTRGNAHSNGVRAVTQGEALPSSGGEACREPLEGLSPAENGISPRVETQQGRAKATAGGAPPPPLRHPEAEDSEGSGPRHRRHQTPRHSPFQNVTPMMLFVRFLKFYSHFDFAHYCVTAFGPLKLESINLQRACDLRQLEVPAAHAAEETLPSGGIAGERSTDERFVGLTPEGQRTIGHLIRRRKKPLLTVSGVKHLLHAMNTGRREERQHRYEQHLYRQHQVSESMRYARGYSDYGRGGAGVGGGPTTAEWGSHAGPVETDARGDGAESANAVPQDGGAEEEWRPAYMNHPYQNRQYPLHKPSLQAEDEDLLCPSCTTVLFPVRCMNIMDPLRWSSNMARGVCRNHMQRILLAFREGLRRLAKASAELVAALLLSSPSLAVTPPSSAKAVLHGTAVEHSIGTSRSLSADPGGIHSNVSGGGAAAAAAAAAGAAPGLGFTPSSDALTGSAAAVCPGYPAPNSSRSFAEVRVLKLLFGNTIEKIQKYSFCNYPWQEDGSETPPLPLHAPRCRRCPYPTIFCTEYWISKMCEPQFRFDPPWVPHTEAEVEEMRCLGCLGEVMLPYDTEEGLGDGGETEGGSECHTGHQDSLGGVNTHPQHTHSSPPPAAAVVMRGMRGYGPPHTTGYGAMDDVEPQGSEDPNSCGYGPHPHSLLHMGSYTHPSAYDTGDRENPPHGMALSHPGTTLQQSGGLYYGSSTTPPHEMTTTTANPASRGANGSTNAHPAAPHHGTNSSALHPHHHLPSRGYAAGPYRGAGGGGSADMNSGSSAGGGGYHPGMPLHHHSKASVGRGGLGLASTGPPLSSTSGGGPHAYLGGYNSPLSPPTHPPSHADTMGNHLSGPYHTALPPPSQQGNLSMMGHPTHTSGNAGVGLSNPNTGLGGLSYAHHPGSAASGGGGGAGRSTSGGSAPYNGGSSYHTSGSTTLGYLATTPYLHRLSSFNGHHPSLAALQGYGGMSNPPPPPPGSAANASSPPPSQRYHGSNSHPSFHNSKPKSGGSAPSVETIPTPFSS